jgi:FdhE protein
MTAIETGVQNLKRRHPEWGPWLAVVQEVLGETNNPEWGVAVPVRAGTQQNGVPLLSGATLTLEKKLLRGWLERLIQTALRSGTPKMGALQRARGAALDISTLFKAALCQDADRLTETAAVLGADPEALQAVAALVPVPFLHACNRRWVAATSAGWAEGYCPVCGAWPALAEVRGIERSRYLRCGRCGGAWQTHCLSCPYCGTNDHEKLVSLVADRSGALCVIDACKHCFGYVKTFTTLQGSPPAQILLDDFASVDFDVAAFEQGYRRPQGAGYALNVTVTETRRFFS